MLSLAPGLLVLLLCTSTASALQVLDPPSGTPSTFLAEFGCTVTSAERNLAVFAPSYPSSDSLDAWRLYTYAQGTTPTSWRNGPTVSPSSAANGFPRNPSSECFIDMNADRIVIGEPWANRGQGRVLLTKLSSNGSIAPPSVLDVGSAAGDGFGGDVAIFNEWLVATAPHGASKYVNIYSWSNSQFEFHSQLTKADIIGSVPNESDVAFGTWVDMRHNWMVIGSPSETGVGAVFVFKYVAGEQKWKLFQTLSPLADLQGGDDSSFGSVVTIRNKYLFVSAPGTSTTSGSVYVYQYGAHDEWQIWRLLKSTNPERADQYGRFISASDTTLAVSQAVTNLVPSSQVHVYRQCGQYQLALPNVIVPDEAERLDSHWGQRLAWNMDSLVIASRGLVNIWTLPPAPSPCALTPMGAFPAASCCDGEKAVIVSPDDIVVVSGAASTTVSFIEKPVFVVGNLEIESTSVLGLRYGTYVEVEKRVSFAGKLKYEIPAPSDINESGHASAFVPNLVRFASKSNSFHEIEVTFEGQRSCDRVTVQPHYESHTLSLLLYIIVPKGDCPTSSSNPLLPVYIALGILALLIVLVVLALWRFPQLREMISRPTRGHTEYRHTRLANDEVEADERQLASFQQFPGDETDDTSVGAELASDEDEDDHDEDFI